jgi:hypothetical protein
MYRSITFILFAVTWCSLAVGSSFEGEWVIVWPCAGSTGIYADRCAEGIRDLFVLDISVFEKKICGFHLASGQLGNKVDDGTMLDGNPTITGSIQKDLAKVVYRSAWGATGTAAIRVRGKKLYWTVLTESNDESWFPSRAVLTKRSGVSRKTLDVCSKTAKTTDEK